VKTLHSNAPRVGDAQQPLAHENHQLCQEQRLFDETPEAPFLEFQERNQKFRLDPRPTSLPPNNPHSGYTP